MDLVHGEMDMSGPGGCCSVRTEQPGRTQGCGSNETRDWGVDRMQTLSIEPEGPGDPLVSIIMAAYNHER